MQVCDLWALVASLSAQKILWDGTKTDPAKQWAASPLHAWAERWGHGSKWDHMGISKHVGLSFFNLVFICFHRVNYSLAPPNFSHLCPLLTCDPLVSLTPQNTHWRPPLDSLAPPGLPQCHHPKSTSLLKLSSLFKLPSPWPSTMPWSKIYLFI